MITWNDFVLDERIGPLLSIELEEEATQSRRTRLGSPGIMDDARDTQIQETRQEKAPARMAGSASLDSLTYGKEANRAYLAASEWRKERG